MLNVLALGFATQAIVSACGGFVIVWNVLLAPFVLAEHLTRIRLIASAFILGGTVGVGLSGPHYEIVRTELEYTDLFMQPQSKIYLLLLGAFCAIATWRWRRDPLDAGRPWGAVLGGAFAGNNFFLKAAIAVVECSVDQLDGDAPAGCVRNGSPWAHWQVYAIVLLALTTAAGSLIVLAVALRHSEALDAVALFTGTQIVFSALSCNIILQENQVAWGWVVMIYCLSVGVILIGLTLLAIREMRYPIVVEDEPLEWYARLVDSVRGRLQETLWRIRGVDLDLGATSAPPAAGGTRAGGKAAGAGALAGPKGTPPVEQTLLLAITENVHPQRVTCWDNVCRMQ